jgi:hypothetical protein
MLMSILILTGSWRNSSFSQGPIYSISNISFQSKELLIAGRENVATTSGANGRERGTAPGHERLTREQRESYEPVGSVQYMCAPENEEPTPHNHIPGEGFDH